MRILKRGKLPEEVEYTTKCLNCSTEFSFIKVEAKYESHRNESFLIVKCPLCNKDCWKML